MAGTLPAQVAELILADYVSGASAGVRLPSVRELHARYGVSCTTIAHALSILAGQGRVATHQGRGSFVVSGSANGAKGRLNVLGFVMPGTDSVGIVMQTYAGVERACRKHGFEIMVNTSSFDYDRERANVHRLVESGCRGIVLMPVSRSKSQLRKDYLKSELKDFPIVLVDIAFPEQGRTQVIFDNYHAGYEMTMFLLQEGHQHIAFIDLTSKNGEKPLHRSTADRFDGYRDALRTVGKRPRAQDLWSVRAAVTEHEMETERLLRTWKKQSHRATAVLALEDQLALDLIYMAGELGIRVPQDLRIVGFDGIPFCRGNRAMFPTTKPDFNHAGRLAVDLVIKLIHGETPSPVVYMLPVPVKVPKKMSLSWKTLVG